MRRAFFWLAFAALVSGQGTPRFEVASVKPTNPDARGAMNCQGGPGTSDPTHFICANAPLKMLICLAYDVQFYQVMSPEWSKTVGYDITALIPRGATREQFHAMLQQLLEERFHLSLRRESKQLSTYTLTIAKGGPKMLASTANTAPAMTTGARGDGRLLTAHKQSTANLAGYLSVQLQTQVIDKTGLTDNYDFLLQFAPPDASAQLSSPSIFTAVNEQLGLALREQKAPVSTLVVERADRMPTAN